MKTNNMKLIPILAFGLIISIPKTLSADIKAETFTDTRVYDEVFTVNADASVSFNTMESDVTLHTWGENKVKVKVTVSVEAWEQEDLKTMFEILKPSIIGSATEVTISGGNCNYSIHNNSNKIKVTSGDLKAKVKEYNVTYELWMPKTNNVKAKSRYGSLVLGEHTADLNLELFECELAAAGANPKRANISMKYSSGKIGNIGSVNLQLFETELTTGNIEILDLKTRYSSLVFGSVASVTVESFEDVLTLGNVTSLKGSKRYGSIVTANVQNLSLETFEVNGTFGAVDKLELNNSRYSELSAKKVKELTMLNGFENELSIADAESARVTGRYCKLAFEKLSKELTLEGFETECRIGQLKTGFDQVSVSGKYNKVIIITANDAGYAFEAHLQYGNVKMESSDFDFSTKSTEGDRVDIVAKKKGYSGNSAISFTGFESELEIN